jgi:hypothetical protein
MAYMGNSIPIAPVAIDTSRIRGVASRATIISAAPPNRSDQAARLKNSHHTTTAGPPINPAKTPATIASGTKTGTTNQASHCTVTTTTPGQSRIGFREVISPVCAMGISTSPWMIAPECHESGADQAGLEP